MTMAILPIFLSRNKDNHNNMIREPPVKHISLLWVIVAVMKKRSGGSSKTVVATAKMTS